MMTKSLSQTRPDLFYLLFLLEFERDGYVHAIGWMGHHGGAAGQKMTYGIA